MKFSNLPGYYPPSRGAVGGAVVRSVRGAQHMKRYHVPKKQVSTQFSISNQATIWAQYFMQQWLLQPQGAGTFFEAVCALYGWQTTVGEFTSPDSAEFLTQVTKGCAAYLTLGLKPDPTVAYSPPFGDGVTAPFWMNLDFYYYFVPSEPMWRGNGFGRGLDAFEMSNPSYLDSDGVTPIYFVMYASDALPSSFVLISNYPATPNPPDGPLVGPEINNNAPACKIVYAGTGPGVGPLTWNVRDYWQAAYPSSVGPVYFTDYPTVLFSGYYVSSLMGIGAAYPQTQSIGEAEFFAGLPISRQENLIYDNTTVKQYFGRNSSQKLAANIVAGTYPVPLPGSPDRAAWAGRSTARAAAMAGKGGIWPGAPPHFR